MARVIKAGQGGQKPTRPATRMIVDAGGGDGKKIIDRAMFAAKQDAEHILKRAEEERHAIIAEGKKASARAREEAMARGASEAFAAAAAEALAAFKARADRYGEAADDIRALALEVVRKILGNEPDLGPREVDKIMQRGMAQLRARRRLRLQVPPKRLSELAGERPNLMKALQSEPDLVIEAVDDISVGFARVVTEVGGALCAEETALDALSATVNVREQPRERRSSSNNNSSNTGITNASTAPSGTQKLRAAHGNTSGTDPSLSEANIEDVEEVEADDDTMNLSPASAPAIVAAARAARAAGGGSSGRMASRGDDVEEIEAEEDDLGDEPTARRPGFNRDDISATGRGEDLNVASHNNQSRRPVPIVAGGGGGAPGNRAATRAVPLPASSATNKSQSEGDNDEEDLDLFTDDAVRTPRKKR